MTNYGFVGFAMSKNEWSARAIAWFTKSKWSHSFITVPDILGREMVMEAGTAGVEMTPFDRSYRNDPNQSFEVFRFKILQENINLAILQAIDLLESPYGFLEYPWFMWRAFLAWLGKDIKSQNNWSQQGTVCSGLVRLYIELAGYAELFSGFGKDSAHQQDVYDIVIAHPELFELVESKS